MRIRINPPPKYAAIVTVHNEEFPLCVFSRTTRGILPIALAVFTTREKAEDHVKKTVKKLSSGKVVELGKDISCTDFMTLLCELIQKTFETCLKKDIPPEEVVALVLKWPMEVDPEDQFADKTQVGNMPTYSDLFTAELNDSNQDNEEIAVLHENGFTIFVGQNRQDKDFAAIVFEGNYASRAEALARKNRNCKQHVTDFYDKREMAEKEARNWISDNSVP